jgi:sensor histidine kinase YesM
MFTIKYRYVYIVLLALYSYASTSFSEVTRYYPVPGTALDLILAFLLITALIWESNRIVQRALVKKPPFANTIYNLIAHFCISILLASAVSAGVAIFAADYIYHVAPHDKGIIVKLAITLGTRINLFLHVINTIFFFSVRLKAKEIETETLKRANAQAQLEAVKNQLNPHFLFNNLNALSTLILTERPEANKFIEEFSIVYRHVLNTQQQELVPLQQELEFIQHYFFLIKQRFPDSIEVDINVPISFQSLLVVPVALQMLIENAIKHNIASSAHPLLIEIRIDAPGRLVVSNNLQPKTAVEASTQLGLKNIDQRYLLINQQHINITQTETVFSVSLPLISHLP